MCMRIHDPSLGVPRASDSEHEMRRRLLQQRTEPAWVDDSRVEFDHLLQDQGDVVSGRVTSPVGGRRAVPEPDPGSFPPADEIVEVCLVVADARQQLLASPRFEPATGVRRAMVAHRRSQQLPRKVEVLPPAPARSEEHTSELQSRENLVCRLLLEKKKKKKIQITQKKKKKPKKKKT